jgi:hypothetical protein
MYTSVRGVFIYDTNLTIDQVHELFIPQTQANNSPNKCIFIIQLEIKLMLLAFSSEQDALFGGVY